MTPIPEDDDGYKSNGTVVDHTNLRFWRSLQQNVRRSASPSAVSATSIDEHRANPIATLTAAPTIVNAPGTHSQSHTPGLSLLQGRPLFHSRSLSQSRPLYQTQLMPHQSTLPLPTPLSQSPHTSLTLAKLAYCLC